MKKLLGPLLLIFMLSSCPAAAQTQRGGGVRVLGERGEVQSVRLYEGSYALVVGAANYRYWPRLSGVREDVPAVRAVLERHGFKVEELIDPTGDALLSRINKFINDYGLYPDNRLLIYFSGHGFTEVSGDGRKFGYIVPVDAPKPENDIIGFQQKSLTMDEIETAAKRIRSKHALFVFDSCFSGTLVNRSGLHVPKVIDYYATRPVRQFITAGADNQQVPDESVFRQVFVRGLEGKADQNGDGYVTGTELATYLQDQVTYYRGDAQTPQYGKIRDPRLDSGDFIFILPDPTLDPWHADEYYNRGLLNDRKGDSAQAIADYTKAIELYPQHYLAYNSRGNLHNLKGNYDRAIADHTRAIELNPGIPSAYNNRGADYYRKGDYDRAIADYDRALGLSPRDTDTYFNRGLAYTAKGDYSRAIADYDRTIELNPQYARAYYNRGNVHYDKGDYDRAIADYSEAIRLNPDYVKAYSDRADAYEKVGQMAKARADREKADELGRRGVKQP